MRNYLPMVLYLLEYAHRNSAAERAKVKNVWNTL